MYQKRLVISRIKRLVLLAATVLTLCVACGTPQAPVRTRTLTMGLAYIPNIQFAPFYVADALGYYTQAGLHVTLRHHAFSEDEFGALVAGKEDVIFAGGDEMLQARSRHIPLIDVVNLYAQYPVTLIVPADSPIHTIADLRGRTIGTPGPYGETYFGLLALLQSAGLSTREVHIQYIGFTQVAALVGHKVDAVMGYLNNEFVALAEAQVAVRSFPLSEVVHPLPLVSNGLGVLPSVLEKRPEDIRAVIAATLLGFQYVSTHPEQAVEISKQYIPGLGDLHKAAAALAILKATIPLWQDEKNRQGYLDPATWQAMARFLLAYHILSRPEDPATAYSNNYLPT